jgi:coenzyme F420-reducing hydrogenase beta subunit
MRFNWQGEYRPKMLGQCRAVRGSCQRCRNVCPFFQQSPTSPKLPQRPVSELLGSHQACYAGHLASESARRRRSSGGLATWFLARLLEQGKVDAVCGVRQGDRRESNRPLFEYAVVRSAAAVRGLAKSAYYPVELSQVVREISEKPGRYAVIGLPCAVRALRRAAQLDAVLRTRLVVLAGLACGGSRSRFYADYLCKLAGANPSRLLSVDFRCKDAGALASEYATQFIATTPDGRRELHCLDHLRRGRVWNSRWFEPVACRYCTDVAARDADVVFMDAWSRPYVSNGHGTNLALVREPDCRQLLELAARSGEIALKEVEEAVIHESISGVVVYRHERLKGRNGLIEHMEVAWQQLVRVLYGLTRSSRVLRLAAGPASLSCRIIGYVRARPRGRYAH